MGFIEQISSARRARFGRQAADRLHRSYRPSALSYLTTAMSRRQALRRAQAQKLVNAKLTEVCQSRQPLSLKRLYRRLKVVLPLQWPYASGVESSSGLALLRGDTYRSGSHASMRRQFALVLFGDRQDKRSTYSARSCGGAYR